MYIQVYNKSRVLLGEEQPQGPRRVGPVDDLDLVRADLVVELADRVLDGLLASVLPLATRSEALARAGAARFTTSYPSCSPSPFCYSIQNPGPGRASPQDAFQASLLCITTPLLTSFLVTRVSGHPP